MYLVSVKGGSKKIKLNFSSPIKLLIFSTLLFIKFVLLTTDRSAELVFSNLKASILPSINVTFLEPLQKRTQNPNKGRPKTLTCLDSRTSKLAKIGASLCAL